MKLVWTNKAPQGKSGLAQPSLVREVTDSSPSLQSDGPALPLPKADGEAGWYTNADGLVVFTAKYLLKRGYCCGNGCKHCPFGYAAVPEPKRSYLLHTRNEEKNNNR